MRRDMKQRPEHRHVPNNQERMKANIYNVRVRIPALEPA